MVFNHPFRGANTAVSHPLVRSSSHAMAVGGVLLLFSLWPLLVTFENWPFSYVLPFTISLPVAAGFVLGCLLELCLRGWNFRVFMTLILSGMALAAWVLSLVLSVRHLSGNLP